MKKKLTLSLFLLLASLVVQAQSAVQSATRFVGGDISMLTKYEEAGVVYKDKNGTAVQPLTFFKDAGLNAMRVRLFVDPSASTDKAVCQDLDYVKALGKRIKAAGMSLMVDFHYSDIWADPSNQWTPDAWKSMNDTELAIKVYEYTKDCLNKMKADNAAPDFIQIGNEISYGMLWGAQGSSNPLRCYTNSPAVNWTRFYNLLKQAAKACRDECPNAKIVLHSERVPNTGVLTDFFDRMKSNSVDYDIIGLSYYPDHHGNLAKLETALNSLENKNYGKDIMIVETGYGYKWSIGTEYDYTATYPLTEEGQRQFTADLIATLSKHDKVTGLFWWWMEDNGNANVTPKYWNAGLYNHNSGAPYAAFYELKKFVDSKEAEQETDVTGQFVNMDFENGETNIAWTINYDGWGTSGPWPKQKDQWHSSLCSGYLLQGWCEHVSNLPAGNIIWQSQENMPTGTYRVSAAVHTDYEGVYLFANDDTQLVSATSDWGTAYETEVTTTLSSPGTLTVGLKLLEKPTATAELNLYTDNFKVASLTTNIEATRATMKETDNVWYTLDGRRLTGVPCQKGLYIHQGKKFIVR